MPDIYSSASATVSATVIFDEWWLKDPTDAALNQELEVDSPLRFQRTEQQTVFRPLGRPLPIVVSGSLAGESGTLVLHFTTQADFDAFEDIRATQRVLLLQSPFGDNLYVRLGDNADATLVHAGEAIREREVSIDFTEVTRP